MLDIVQMDNSAVLEGLASQDNDRIRSVCFEAGERGLLSAVPLLVEHLQSDNLGIQEAAEFALRNIRSEVAVEAIAPLLRSESVPIRNAAMDILREIAADHVLTLVKLLHDEDVDIRIFSADILGTTNSLLAMSALCESLLSDVDVNVRYQAASSLGILGFSGAAQTLHLALKDDEWVQFAAIEALSSIRDDTCVDILIEDLDIVSPFVASTIISALGEMDNIKAAPVLLSRLDTLPRPLRNKAVKAIIQILGPSSLGYLGNAALERFHIYLIEALDDAGDDVIEAALVGLTVLASGEGAEAILRYAKTLDPLRDADKMQAVIECLASIGHVEALAKGLLSKDMPVVICCIDACGEIGSKECAQALYKAFWHLDAEQQRLASQQLFAIADVSFTSEAIAVLDRHSDSQVLKDVLLFLGKKVRAVEVAPTLLAYLEHPFDDVKEVALEACLGLQHEPTNKRIVGFIHDEKPLKRLMAIYAMGQIDADAYFLELAEALTDPLPDLRKTALRALAHSENISPERLSLLGQCLKDDNRDMRMVATEYFKQFSYEQAAPYLYEALKDSDPWVRIRAVEGFEFFTAFDAIPALIAELVQGEVLVGLKVVKALGVFGGDVAFHALLDHANHEDPEIQRAVAMALDHMRSEIGEIAL